MFRPKWVSIIFFSHFLGDLNLSSWAQFVCLGKEEPLAAIGTGSSFQLSSSAPYSFLGVSRKSLIFSLLLQRLPREPRGLHSPAVTEMLGCEALTSYMGAKDPSEGLTSPGEGGFAGFIVSLNT